LKEVLGANPYSKQIEQFELTQSHRRVSIAGCNGSGKDWTSGRIVLWWMLTHYPAKVIVTGPTARQVNDIVWNETRFAFNNAKVPLGGRMLPSSARWMFDEQHFAVGVVSSDPMNLQGFHSPNLLVVITEAHAVKQPDVEALRRLNAKCTLLTGNPFATQGEFYDSHHSMRDLYGTLQVSAFDTPNVQAGREVVEGMINLEDIEDRKREWGEDSAMYKASVLGQFPDNLDDVVIPLSLVMEAKQRINQPSGEVIVSCDVARFGEDSTVVFRRQGDVADIIYKVQGRNLMEIAGWLGRYAEDNHVDYMVVDDTGLGGGVTDRLGEIGVNCHLVPFKGGSRADQHDRFSNAITESWWMLREWLGENGQIPNEDSLIGQLTTRGYSIQSDRRLILQSKKELSKSPDEADALAMTFIPMAGYGIW